MAPAMDAIVGTFNIGGGSDPLAHILAPPADETEEAKAERISAEKRAKQRSDAIDEEIEAQRIAARRGPKPVKILLLGQSESGKSTTLKNFQLMYEPKAFERERASWRSVIQLNLVQSFHLILDAFTREQAAHPSSRPFTLPPDLLKVKARLAPLLQLEEALRKRLVPEGSDEKEPTMLDRTKSFVKEIAVQANWKNDWAKGEERGDVGDSHRLGLDDDEIAWNDPTNPTRLLHDCSADMIKLWNDPITHRILANQKLRMEEVAGFFLDQVQRLTTRGYVPSDDDILKARLKTLGVTEHRFKLKRTADFSGDWRIYDVGGHRSQRDAWAPYFDDMNAIIFLAPISCFNQVMAEDGKYNRLQDSFDLWVKLLSNPLLKHTDLILFLNKTDIFRQKIESGIKFGDYVVSYGSERENTVEAVIEYIRKKFLHLMKKYSSNHPRPFYVHLTSVTDTQSTKLILLSLEEMLIRKGLVKGNLVM